MLSVAVTSLPVFGLQIGPRWWPVLPVLVLGVATFLALGFLVRTFIKAVQAVTAIVNYPTFASSRASRVPLLAESSNIAEFHQFGVIYP